MTAEELFNKLLLEYSGKDYELLMKNRHSCHDPRSKKDIVCDYYKIGLSLRVCKDKYDKKESYLNLSSTDLVCTWSTNSILMTSSKLLNELINLKSDYDLDKIDVCIKMGYASEWMPEDLPRGSKVTGIRLVKFLKDEALCFDTTR